MNNPFRALAVQRIPSFHHEHHSYRWWVLGNVLITTFMAVLEATVVNTALPTMQNAFGTSLDIIEWVLTAFNLVFAVVLPLSGWLADKIGYKRTFFLSLALFTFGSFACSFAWNEDVLIFFRVIQGIGGGMIQPVGLAIVTREFPPQQRGMALGFYGIAAAASLSVGPSLGGYLTDTFGWSSVFLINVPFGILSMVATVLIQREYKKADMGPFDIWGFSAITVFLVSLLLALADGNAGWNSGGWTSPFILTCFTISAVSLVWFLVVELTIEHPIIDLKLLTEWNFGISSFMLFMIGILLLGSTFLMPLYFQGSLGYTALQSGMMFLPLGIVQGLTSPITGILSDKLGPKVPAALGVLFLAFSFLMNTFMTTEPPLWLLLAPLFIRGVGLGLLFIAIQAMAINSLPREKMAQGSGMITLTRQIGASFGVAIVGSIFSQRNIFHTAMLGEGVNTSQPAFQQVTSQLKATIFAGGGQTLAAASSLSGAMVTKQLAAESFVQSVDDVFLVVALATFLSLIPVLFMKKIKKVAPPPGSAPAPAHVAMD